MRSSTLRATGTLGLLAAAALILAACGAPTQTPETEAADPPVSQTQNTEGDAAEGDTDSAAGAVDCRQVGLAVTAWLEAVFAGISTEITNAELAAEWDAALEVTRSAPDPGGELWDAHISVLEKYASEWHALPAGGEAFEHIEPIEETVDEYAETLGYDNDNFEDMVPILGEKCNEELEEMFQQAE